MKIRIFMCMILVIIFCNAVYGFNSTNVKGYYNFSDYLDGSAYGNDLEYTDECYLDTIHIGTALNFTDDCRVNLSSALIPTGTFCIGFIEQPGPGDEGYILRSNRWE